MKRRTFIATAGTGTAWTLASSRLRADGERSGDHGATWGPAQGSPYELPLQPNSREHGLEHPSPEVVAG